MIHRIVISVIENISSRENYYFPRHFFMQQKIIMREVAKIDHDP